MLKESDVISTMKENDRIPEWMNDPEMVEAAKRYELFIQKQTHLRSIFLPGDDSVRLGGVLHKEDDTYFYPNGENIRINYGVDFHYATYRQADITIETTRIKKTYKHGDSEISVFEIPLGADISGTYEFEAADQWWVRFSDVKVDVITNLTDVGQAIKDISHWPHSKNFIAWKVYRAGSFAVFGDVSGNKKMKFKSSGQAILEFASLGIGGRQMESFETDTLIRTMGQGPVLQGVVKVRENGKIEHKHGNN